MKHAERFKQLIMSVKPQIRETTLDIVKEKLNNNMPFVLVDVREESEWAKGHLPHAIHIGKGVIERDIEKNVPDTHTEVVLYCGGGFRSALAAENLQRMGYTNVWSMDGGFRGWQEKGYPIVAD